MEDISNGVVLNISTSSFHGKMMDIVFQRTGNDADPSPDANVSLVDITLKHHNSAKPIVGITTGHKHNGSSLSVHAGLSEYNNQIQGSVVHFADVSDNQQKGPILRVASTANHTKSHNAIFQVKSSSRVASGAQLLRLVQKNTQFSRSSAGLYVDLEKTSTAKSIFIHTKTNNIASSSVRLVKSYSDSSSVYGSVNHTIGRISFNSVWRK